MCLFWPEFVSAFDEEPRYQQLLRPYLEPLLLNLMEGLQFTEEDILNQLPKETSLDQESADLLQNTEFTLRRQCGQCLESLAKFYNL